MTDNPSRTLLVLAYSISPIRGSEYAVGWNYVTHMARHHRLIVLYGLAGDHMGDAQEIAGYRGTDAGATEFVFVAPGPLARLINRLNVSGILPFSFYIAYRLWHRTAARKAAAILAAKHVDIVHYLCPIGYREPGDLWKLDKPYIWGPIGGMNLRPLRPFRAYGIGAVLKTAGRNLANWLQFRASVRVHQAIAKADVVIANTSENARLIEQVHGRTPLIMPENAITAFDPRPHELGSGPVALIWVGRIDTAKALEILIHALALLKDRQWSLEVVGDGPRAEQARALSRTFGIDDRIGWTGQLPRTDVQNRFRHADLHVLTSLAEAHSTVLWEAMSLGVPTIAFDHCGMHDSICDACGVKVPVSDFPTMATALAAAIDPLLIDRERIAGLSAGALRCASARTWAKREIEWEGIYDLAIERHRSQREGPVA